MKLNANRMSLAVAGAVVVLAVAYRIDAATPEDSNESTAAIVETTPAEADRRVTLDEARGQAELLHETLHATLQVVHRRYYREDEGLPIPSRSLESVFAKLSRQRDIEFHWLAVNAQAMSIDHEPQDEFEHNAVKALRRGEESFEQVEEDVYRRAGAITLFSQCLKCHAPNRMSTSDRLAGLVISIPYKSE
jgi:hypothetical protein